MHGPRRQQAHLLLAHARRPAVSGPRPDGVIAREPEFVRPQDGVEKQDCELRAAERWLDRNTAHFGSATVTLLDDDLYCHQPFCERVLAAGWHFTSPANRLPSRAVSEVTC